MAIGTVKERVSGNIFIRECSLAKADDVIDDHVHTYDHTCFVMRGAIRLTIDGEVKDIEAPADVLIEGGKVHQMIALTDDTVFYCVFNHRDRNGTPTNAPVQNGAYW